MCALQPPVPPVPLELVLQIGAETPGSGGLPAAPGPQGAPRLPRQPVRARGHKEPRLRGLLRGRTLPGLFLGGAQDAGRTETVRGREVGEGFDLLQYGLTRFLQVCEVLQGIC